MKTKIILIAFIACCALASLAATRGAKKNSIRKSANAALTVQVPLKPGGFVSEEF